jgi:photosystem I subunit III
MRRLLPLILIAIIWFSIVPSAKAENTTLIPCSQSKAFAERMKKARDNYYFDKPSEAYSKYLLCGDEGLPHLPLDRLDRAPDVAIPIALFLYIAGFIGWSGRSYLQAASKSKSPEMMEIFINIPLALASFGKGLMWPLLAVQELISGKLTVPDDQIPVSPR